MSNALKIRQVQSSVGSVIPLHACASSSKKIKNPPASKVVKETLGDVIKSEDEDKRLPNGWYKLSPFLNSWVKVLDTGQELPSTVWVAIFVKEHSSVHLGVPHMPVPKTSLIYQYILSKEPEKQKTLQTFEKAIMEEFLNAKKFLPLGHLAQTGIDIVGRKKFVMAVRGFLGIAVAYPYVDVFLKAIEEDDKNEISKLRNFFKGGFVHEIVHELRNEFSKEKDGGEEIASHAVEILATMGDDPIKDKYLQEVVENEKKLRRQDALYNKDVIAAMKVVKEKLTVHPECQYTPQTFEPSELNKTMKSIPEDKRMKVLSQIAKKIVKTSPIELLRQAAEIKVVVKKNDVENFLKISL